MLYGSMRRGIHVIAVLISVALLILTVSATAPTVAAKSKKPRSTDYSWQQLKIGGGGFVTGIALHPTVSGLVYIRTDVGGVYKLGANDTWQQLLTASAVPHPTPNDYSVERLAVSASNPQMLYLAVGNDLDNQNGRILKSSNQGRSFTDNGQRWYMGGNQDGRQGAERLAVDPHNDNVAYFGSRKQGLWVTTDGGQT